MKLSLDWLSAYVSFTEHDPQKIAEALTLSVAEVEAVEIQGELLADCCVGKILTKEKHPNADRLNICTVETDRGVKSIVCGGTNLRIGMLIAFAHAGARVRHGEEIVTLEKVKIRGEQSEGMICAAHELDLSELFPPKKEEGEFPVIDLGNQGYEVGKSLRAALGLDDIIFHIDNHSITHRADLFSHIGFARECVAIGLGSWKSEYEFSAPAFAKSPIPFAFIVDAPKGMPRYCACMLEIDGLGQTPEWMVRRLRATGWRSLNLPIDITNYVAMEVGVPLHSFDAGDFVGDIHMRESKKGEKITTLDGVERALPDGALILSDGKGIFDLLGVMGGLRSSTKDSTRKIYLHSASLDPVAIRRAVIGTGHRTDAATVYEKGVPHVTTEQGFLRALQLFLELVPGARIVSALESVGDNGKPSVITLSQEHLSKVLGRTIDVAEAKRSLEPLGFAVETNAKELRVTPPLHRLGDIHEDADIIEEVSRIASFASFEPLLPVAPLRMPGRMHARDLLRDLLREQAFTEIIGYSFIGAELLRKTGMTADGCIEISNPLGEDMRFMRPSLLPRMLEFAGENLESADHLLRTFEIGHTFSGEAEQTILSLFVAARHGESLKEDPVLILKRTLLECLGGIGLQTAFVPSTTKESYMHPARFASVTIGDSDVGRLYEVHPVIREAFGLSHRTAVAEINLDILFALPRRERLYKEIPSFPSISYDATLPLGPDARIGELLKVAGKSHPLLADVRLIDIYEKGGERHFTFRFTYAAKDRTLTEEEVRPVQARIEAALANN